MKIEAICECVRKECLGEQNVLGPSFFAEHIQVVAEYAAELALRLSADTEIVTLAAYLHDISAVRDITTLPDHASASAEIALEMLGQLGYAADRSERVSQCIRSHSAPVSMDGGTVEEVCLSNADAIAQIVRPAFWCYFAFAVRKMSFEDGRRWLRERKQANWAAMIDPARKLAREGYEVSVGCLRNVEHPLSAYHS